jgi:hypothetical protein
MGMGLDGIGKCRMMAFSGAKQSMSYAMPFRYGAQACIDGLFMV